MNFDILLSAVLLIFLLVVTTRVRRLEKEAKAELFDLRMKINSESNLRKIEVQALQKWMQETVEHMDARISEIAEEAQSIGLRLEESTQWIARAEESVKNATDALDGWAAELGSGLPGSRKQKKGDGDMLGSGIAAILGYDPLEALQDARRREWGEDV